MCVFRNLVQNVVHSHGNDMIITPQSSYGYDNRLLSISNSRDIHSCSYHMHFEFRVLGHSRRALGAVSHSMHHATVRHIELQVQPTRLPLKIAAHQYLRESNVTNTQTQIHCSPSSGKKEKIDLRCSSEIYKPRQRCCRKQFNI